MGGVAGAGAPPGGNAGAGAPPGGNAGAGAPPGGNGAIGGAGVAGVGFGFGGCFEAGSLIATPSGSVPIETLAVGDEVLAFDERLGRVVPRAVTQTFVHTVPQSGRLRLADGRELRVTAEHPIYLASRGSYARADQVDGDAALLSLTASRAGADPLQGVALGVEYTRHGFSAVDRTTVVYNISVDGLENYFVDGVLVHNKSGTGPIGGAGCGSVPWRSDDCAAHPGCISHENPVEMVAADQPAPDGAGAPELDVTVCSALPPSSEALIAVDVWLATPQSSWPGFEVYRETATCAGTLFGEMGVPYSPATAGWTTQCFQVQAAHELSRFGLVSRDGTTLVKNPRFVQACACKRQLYPRNTCLPPVSTSACL
jgi:hypothetical protein